MDYQLLLLEDIYRKGRKGDVVKVKSGFARNFLLPQKKAVLADKKTLKMQQRLQEERAVQAKHDLAESEKIASHIEGKKFETIVKVDDFGNLYGSVSIGDIVELLKGNGVEIEKQSVHLAHAIKKLGEYTINVRLKEGVRASFQLKVLPDREITVKVEAPAPLSSPPAEEMPQEE